VFIGSEIGSTGIKVDGYGGGIMRAMRDGKWTIRHDKPKLFLWDLCRQAQMDPSSCEVHNVFAKHISSNYAPNVLPANEGEHPSTQRERWNNFSRGEHDKQGWIPDLDLMMTTTSVMKGSAKTCFGDIKTLNTFTRNQYLSANVKGKRRLAVEAKQKWTHNYYVKRMKKLDKDFNGQR
jgi:hypothetical protein